MWHLNLLTWPLRFATSRIGIPSRLSTAFNVQRSSSSPCLPPSPTRDSSPFVSSSLEIRNFPPSHYHLSKDLSSESDSPAISPPRAKILVDRPFHLSDKPIQMRPDSTEAAFAGSIIFISYSIHILFLHLVHPSPLSFFPQAQLLTQHPRFSKYARSTLAHGSRR